jgi:ABC-type lipoprotein release transport system permease subunit
MRRAELSIPPFLVARLVTRSNRWSLALTVFLMAISFVNLIFVASLFGGIMRGSEDQVINAYVGHITIGPRHGEQVIDHVAETLAVVCGTPGVRGASAQTIVPGVLRHGNTVVAR